jgi:parallel beta-helix repeat protein
MAGRLQQPITHSGTLDVPGIQDNGRIAPYDLGNCLGIRIFNESSPVTLTIEAGVVVQGHVTGHGWSEGIFHNQIAVSKNAALKVLGTADEPVVFTSAANPDERNAGQWGGVVFEADSRASDSIIQHAVFEYGGSNWVPSISNPGWIPGMLSVYGGAPCISDSLFTKSNVSWLCLRESANPTITGCTFTENKIGLTFNMTSPLTISGNRIVQNIDYGAFNENGEVIIDMTNNWWGDDSGPLDDSDDRETGGWYNPEGRGDNVSDYIKYKPWSTGIPTPSPTGYLWLSDFTSDKIYKLDTLGNVLVSFDSPGSLPSDLAWDGTYLWCTDDGWGKGYSNKIFKLDNAGNVITSFDAPQNDSYSGGLAWDGASLWYVRDYTAAYTGTFMDTIELCNEIYQLDTTGNVLSHFTAPSPGSSGLTWDGAHLWVADAWDDLIYQLNTTGKVLESIGSPGSSPIGQAWAETPTSTPPPSALTNCISFNTGEWTDLRSVFSNSTEILGYTNNKYGGTAYRYLWLSFAMPSAISLRPCPTELNPQAGEPNWGDRAELEIEKIASSELESRLSADSVPDDLGAKLIGPYIYRLTVTAPDHGYHSSYIFSFDAPPSYAIGKGKVDDLEWLGRVRVCNIGT